MGPSGTEKYISVILSQQRIVRLNLLYGNPYSRESEFGWIACGKLRERQIDKQRQCFLLNNDSVQNTLKIFFDLEGLGIRDDLVLHERDQAMEIFKETVEFENGRYIVQLPFRKPYNELSDNYFLAKQSFQDLWRRFGHDSELYQQYREFILDYTEQGIIEEVKTETTDNELKRPVYYLPLWKIPQPISSPFLLAATIRHHIEKYKHEFLDTVELLDRSFYVDDLISDGNEFEEALQTSRRAKYIMEAAGMDLRKWITNDANLLEQWKKENLMYTLYMKLFIYDCRNKSKMVGPLTVAELKELEIKLIKHAPKPLFDNKKKEIPSNISNLFPFVDGEGIVRVGERLENASVPYFLKHSANLPKGSKLSILYFNSMHRRLLHVGPQGLQEADCMSPGSDFRFSAMRR
ncbi:integrase catalytic domain-containing protein [Nephila pilipes]|uniref:Integrase catalytic domain-containing protein n=1 Tax=Nephila pilipes TaxID=299642 RepID=A0A8X6QHX6_NEPPI|nr:integrase catalytic domain-containing protein [Nephila pilipes]